MKPTLRSIAVALIALTTLMPTFTHAADEPPTFDVWPAAVPGEKGDVPAEKLDPANPAAKIPVAKVSNVSKPTLTIYRPAKDKDTGASVLICPGGGYSILAWDLEGTEVAAWLNNAGVTGIILKYRVPKRPDRVRYLPPLQDAQRALSLIRSKAGEWGLDPKRIGMLGFSAGGNLTAITCTNYDKRSYDAIDEIDQVSCRPDFGVLVYPAWLVQDGKDAKDELIPEIRVTPQTPPMFLVHAGDDKITSVNSAAMYVALKHAGVAAELHLYPTGGHGFGLRPTTQPCSQWPQRCEDWMKNQKIIGAPTAH